jgi:phage shock protein C
MIAELLAIPLMLLFLIIILSLAMAVLWIWAFVDVLLSKRSTLDKIFWVVVLFILNVFGAIFYMVSKSYMKKGLIMGTQKKLYRSRKDRVIAGVCGGLGKFLGMDPTIIRVLWALSIFLGGTGLLVYIVMWIIVPEEH